MIAQNNSGKQHMATVSTFAERPESSGGREDWLLVSNCQALGLANCLNLATDEVRVEHYNPDGFRKSASEVLNRWDAFERVLIAPQLLQMLPSHFQDSEKIWQIPTILFSAYHPDICYIINGEIPLMGPLGSYHSAIAYAGFKLGMSVDDVLAKYNEEIYAKLGYFNRWDGSKRQLLEKFDEAGLDLGMSFANWTRTGAFMYSNNHVKVQCLMDMAKSILKKAGKEVFYSSGIPHDNLMNGPGFPVYPEIGIRLGVEGSYLFKLGGVYRFIRLEQFLKESFSVYAAAPDSVAMQGNSAMIDNTLHVLGGS